jgi:hypothetical protein
MATIHVDGAKKSYSTARTQVALAMKAARAVAAKKGESVGTIGGKFAISCKRKRTGSKGRRMRGVTCTIRPQNIPGAAPRRKRRK